MKEKKAALRAAEWKYDDKMDKTMAQLHYRRYIHLTGNSLSILNDLQYRCLKIRFFIKHIYDC